MKKPVKWVLVSIAVAVVAFLLGWRAYPAWDPLSHLPVSALVIITILFVALARQRRDVG